jgi:hypothetical protein
MEEPDDQVMAEPERSRLLREPPPHDDDESLSLTAEDAAALVDLAWQRGYFHDNNNDDNDSAAVPTASVGTGTAETRFDKATSWLLMQCTPPGDHLSPPSYVTLSHARDQLTQQLALQGSALCLTAATALHVSLGDLRTRVLSPAWLACDAQAADWILIRGGANTSSSSSSSDNEQEQSQLLTRAHLDKVLVPTVMTWCDDGDGRLPVNTVAARLAFSLADTRRWVSPRLLSSSAGVDEWRDDRGVLVYVSAAYRERLRMAVCQALASSVELVHVPTLCGAHDWPVVWVKTLLQHPPPPAKGGRWPGILRKDDNDYFVPDAYRQRQETIVLEHYHRDGYVLTAGSQVVDMKGHQIQALLRAQFPATAVVLADGVLNYDRVGAPWEALVAEAMAHDTFCELRPPVELLNLGPTLGLFLTDHVLPKAMSLQEQEQPDGGSCLTITVERVLFVSHGMMAHIRTDLVPTLVEPRLQALARRAHDDKAAIDIADTIDREVTVPMLVHALVQGFPSLHVLQHNGGDEILTTFVQEHLLTEEWKEDCLEAVRVEMNRLDAAAETTKLTGRVSHAHSSTAEVALEDPSCFPAACYVIQLQNKFLEYAVKLGMDSAQVGVLEHEILQGCCRDLVRRLTLYLLDKYEVEEKNRIAFVTDPTTSVPTSYGVPVDVALRQYPTVRMEGRALDGKEKEGTLAMALTDSVPIQICKALAELEKAETVEDFIHAAEENCLSICGIPFRKLDKKAEKVFLAFRRQRLLTLLQASQVPVDILDYTIMILYQSVKQQTVAGSLLRGPILQHLVKERKISEAVGRLLTALAESLGANCDEWLVERVRSCGSAKDIAKHVVE